MKPPSQRPPGHPRTSRGPDDQPNGRERRTPPAPGAVSDARDGAHSGAVLDLRHHPVPPRGPGISRWLGHLVAIAAEACLQACSRLRRRGAAEQPLPEHPSPCHGPGFAVTEPVATLLDRCDAMDDAPGALAGRLEALHPQRHGEGLPAGPPARRCRALPDQP